MVNDRKAEELEAKGLYRRAATRWQEVMMICAEDDDREWVKQRRDTCLTNVKRPPVKTDDYGDLHKAVTETQHRMGIAQPNGNAFRLNGGKKQRQATSGGDSSQ
ncbi:TPA: PerC family transcriptional regulator [Enterobacter hormaechei subsp. xiangfangensis]|uniref:PerC family transcriptional regulator n=1 Tax=Enterobacteriaceae TaxID=543 RepID=UPI00066691FC|nr:MULTISPECIES: PerC family transcriptional regulator [Enterobacteriaceae]HAS1804036.1 PerC family transcriptional regulator [Enterobacter hormaechei subsp. xiangfangensis]EFA1206935.1 PerC family transcriptional regulator [Escherichia coli]KUH04604.1 transcriptional regulator [Escherichia coli]NWC62793.1 PerC family transcriptional regulator [Cedecea sp. P7760]HAS1820037.1 PerC family transcriptional regulator [Enterobacter hormaechei subsp. xiangfangensis]